MAVRLKDVAALAGVSVKTASNVVNKLPHVKDSTRARVEAAIAELRYRPNESARQLKHGRSGFLALAVPALEMPYFAELAARIVATATEQGWIVLLDDTRATTDAEQIVINGMRTHVIDGAIFSPLALSAEQIAERSDDLPIVLLGERAVPPGYDHVGVDSVAAAYELTTHLVQLGCRRIAVIGWQPGEGTSAVRHEGYARAMADAGLPYDPNLVIGVPTYERINGRAAMEELLELADPPDAVFCFSDLLAIGALKACAEAGVEVPGRVAIAGFDDITESRFANPGLTTVSADYEFLAQEAVRLLLRRIEDPTAPAELVEVPWQLRIRQSTVGRHRVGLAVVRTPLWTDSVLPAAPEPATR